MELGWVSSVLIVGHGQVLEKSHLAKDARIGSATHAKSSTNKNVFTRFSLALNHVSNAERVNAALPAAPAIITCVSYV